jgi:ADP-ribose pyrophosphatase YjhB (NUDIX family)
VADSLPLAVAAVIVAEGRFLLIQRAREPFLGWWSPVTGRVEPGETLAEAAVREAREEIGLEVEAGAEFFACPTADGTHALHFLRCTRRSGTPTPAPAEVQAWGWFTLDECARLPHFFPSDLRAFRALPR